jgi:chromosome segregation protein
MKIFLKKFKATGFKSFANNIEINFDQQMSGIVGPNGSGKSNIVDAVK